MVSIVPPYVATRLSAQFKVTSHLWNVAMTITWLYKAITPEGLVVVPVGIKFNTEFPLVNHLKISQLKVKLFL